MYTQIYVDLHADVRGFTRICMRMYVDLRGFTRICTRMDADVHGPKGEQRNSRTHDHALAVPCEGCIA